ncbi:MAG: TrkH family potassium uptake protein [Phycisphaerales bacterium]|nr:TrkH family potassium uptake protein [Phycisphaerales bacterium]
MNFRLVIGRMGLLFALLGAIMLGTAGLFGAVELLGVRRDPDLTGIGALGAAGLLGLLLGGAGWLSCRGAPSYLGRREALLLVAASWLMGAALSATPYFLWAHLDRARAGHPFRWFIDCYFEAMSGLTTTGATVLSDIEAMPNALLLWRALTHWLGGLGIVVLFVAVLPGLGVGGKRLFNVEAPGPSPEGLQPHIRETARWLWYIYLALTVAQVALLWGLTPLDLFDSVCHTFGTMATGGFSTRNASTGAYAATPMVDLIIVVFMVLAGMNFNWFYKVCKGRLAEVWRDPELRAYLAMLTVGSALVSYAVWRSADPIVMTTGEEVASGLGASIRQGVFTTVSIQTTTGFCTSDFDRWPFLAHGVLVLLMLVGGCSGSTGGGVKVIRAWAAFKILLAEIEHVFRPQVVRPLRLGRTVMDSDLKLGTLAFIIGMAVLFVGGSGAVMLLEQMNPASECNYTTAATAAIACLCTIGPGLDLVGAVQNYGWLSGSSKAVLSVLMVLGRLEVYAIIVLLSPRFWRDR